MLTIKAALTGVLAFTAATTAALAEPKTNLLSQWSEGSDAAAIAKRLAIKHRFVAWYVVW